VSVERQKNMRRQATREVSNHDALMLRERNNDEK
jgi:hypothetical protein